MIFVDCSAMFIYKCTHHIVCVYIYMVDLDGSAIFFSYFPNLLEEKVGLWFQPANYWLMERCNPWFPRKNTISVSFGNNKDTRPETLSQFGHEKRANWLILLGDCTILIYAHRYHQIAHEMPVPPNHNSWFLFNHAPIKTHL